MEINFICQYFGVLDSFFLVFFSILITILVNHFLLSQLSWFCSISGSFGKSMSVLSLSLPEPLRGYSLSEGLAEPSGLWVHAAQNHMRYLSRVISATWPAGLSKEYVSPICVFSFMFIQFNEYIVNGFVSALSLMYVKNKSTALALALLIP